MILYFNLSHAYTEGAFKFKEMMATFGGDACAKTPSTVLHMAQSGSFRLTIPYICCWHTVCAKERQLPAAGKEQRRHSTQRHHSLPHLVRETGRENYKTPLSATPTAQSDQMTVHIFSHSDTESQRPTHQSAETEFVTVAHTILHYPTPQSDAMTVPHIHT